MILNHNKFIIPGFRALLDYATDKNINNIADCYILIDKLIDIASIEQFKLFMFGIDSLSKNTSSGNKISPKIKEKSIWRLLTLKEIINADSLMQYHFCMLKKSW